MYISVEVCVPIENILLIHTIFLSKRENHTQFTRVIKC